MPRLDRTQLRARFRELRTLLCEWDPLGLMDDPDWPRDEYDGLVGRVLRALEARQPPEALARELERELREHFGLDPAPAAALVFAHRAEAWYRERWPGTGAVPTGG